MGPIDTVRREWRQLRAAPWSFVVVVALTAGASFTVVKFFYSERIEDLKAKLDLRDNQIAQLKSRLDLAVPPGNEFSRLSNGELKAATLAFVAEGRRMVDAWRKRDEELKRAHDRSLFATSQKNEAEISSHRQNYVEQTGRNWNELMANYESTFRVRAKMIREEFRSRVTQPPPAAPSVADYHQPMMVGGVQAVFDDLEHYARSL